MRIANRMMAVMTGYAMLLGASRVGAQDWPQWRGPNRDGKATGFIAPKTWPKELTKKWSVTVGNGVASPALVGDKLYVFTREGDNEITRCLNAADGKEIWKDKYDAGRFSGRGDTGYPGPRSSPTVADGKVVNLSVNGTLSCLDAATGKVVWRKVDFKGSYPGFHTASSPLILDGLCIAQLGGSRNGGIMAFDLASGAEKWKLTGDSPAYASPVAATVAGAKSVVAETASNVVVINAADGKLLWKTAFREGGPGDYNSVTPVVDGQTVIYGSAKRGTKAAKISKEGDTVSATESWNNKEASSLFCTPVLRNGLIFGLSARDNLFCINAETGKTAWSTSIGGGSSGRGGRAGYGTIVDAGSVLFALTPAGSLIVYEPSDKEFKQIAKYKVGESTYAYPIVSGKRIFIKDKDAVTLWTTE